MNQFLDTSIIMGYANAISGKDSLIDKNSEKCVLFAKNKKSPFIVCYFSLDKDIPSLKERMRVIIRAVKTQLNNKDYEIENSEEAKELYKQDIDRFNKLCSLKEIFSAKGLSFEKFVNDFQLIFELRIDVFIKKLVDKKVVPIKEIDLELKSSLFTYTQNHSDANILASGIQYCQKEDVCLVTTDKADWTKANLELAIPEYSELAKKYRKIPEIRYVQDM